MDRIRFEELRRNVLDKFNNLEMLMNLAISMYYFKEINKDFIFRVLHDSLFSSALKISIFLKIIKDSDKKRYNKMTNKIREMANIKLTKSTNAEIATNNSLKEASASLQGTGFLMRP